MKLNWNFLGGWGVYKIDKKHSMGGVWIYSGTVHLVCPFNAWSEL